MRDQFFIDSYGKPFHYRLFWIHNNQLINIAESTNWDEIATQQWDLQSSLNKFNEV